MTLADDILFNSEKYKSLTLDDKVKFLENVVGKLSTKVISNEIILFSFLINNVEGDTEFMKQLEEQLKLDEKFLNEKVVADFKKEIKDL